MNMNEKKLSVQFLREIKPEKTISGRTFTDYSYLCYVSLYLFAAGYCRGKVVLDGACGMGFGSFLLSQFADRTIGLDIDSASLIYARNQYRKENLYFLFSDVTRTSFHDRMFDAIVSIETFEHLHPEQALSCLREFERLLKTGGRLIISTPNRSIHRKISQNADHINEVEVKAFFDMLHTVFPRSEPFYQRKGVLRSMPGFYGLIRADRFKFRRFVPGFVRNQMNRQFAPQLHQNYEKLLQDLRIHKASNLEELHDAVLQVAVCQKTE
jgi:SAM-dependent methyltransferase